MKTAVQWLKEQYIDQLDIAPFKSSNEKITDDELNKAIKVNKDKQNLLIDFWTLCAIIHN